MKSLQSSDEGRFSWSDERRGSHSQLDFLPSALEIQERPPSPTGRALMWLLLGLFSVGLAWSFWGEVDIVVTAPGRVIPSGQVKKVQSPESGVVSSINVKEGQVVAKGELLVSMDPEYVQADGEGLADQLASYRSELDWRTLMESWLSGADAGGIDDTNAEFLLLAKDSDARAQLEQKLAEVEAMLESFDSDLKATNAQRISVEHEIEQTQSSLEVLTERVAAYKALVDRQYGPRVQYLELLQQLTSLQQSRPVLASRVEQLVESARAIAAKKLAALSEVRAANLAAIADLKIRLATLEKDLRKTQKRKSGLRITAPVSGTVQELTVYTLGAVVGQAQELMKIVPNESKIEVEALLRNRDIGFVFEEQRAAVKVDAFNFTKYGMLEAKILDVSNDAVMDEKHGWVFMATLELAQDHLLVEGRQVALIPGMSVTAEIKTGTRRLIEFFLSPLLRYQKESVRER